MMGMVTGARTNTERLLIRQCQHELSRHYSCESMLKIFNAQWSKTDLRPTGTVTLPCKNKERGTVISFTYKYILGLISPA